jgi:hypothetical protein
MLYNKNCSAAMVCVNLLDNEGVHTVIYDSLSHIVGFWRIKGFYLCPNYEGIDVIHKKYCSIALICVNFIDNESLFSDMRVLGVLQIIFAS